MRAAPYFRSRRTSTNRYVAAEKKPSAFADAAVRFGPNAGIVFRQPATRTTKQMATGRALRRAAPGKRTVEEGRRRGLIRGLGRGIFYGRTEIPLGWFRATVRDSAK